LDRSNVIRGYFIEGVSNESVIRIFFTTSSSIPRRLIFERANRETPDRNRSDRNSANGKCADS